jgi:rfaE bifunctional protein nucleotidyltransferase chain/domain
VVRLDRGGRPGARIGPVSAAARAAVGWAQVVLVSDYGRGVAAEPGLRTVLARAARDVPLVWDPHPRGPEPVAGAAVCTPNDAEARAALPGADPGEDGAGAAGRRAGALARRWGAGAVCVTRGADGAVLGTPDAPPVVLAAGVVHGDPCGAGDRFASRLAAALADGAHPAEAARLAVAAATAFVAGGGAGGYAPARTAARPQPTGVPRTPGQPGSWAHAAAVADRIRAAGGTVVATGGCFDLLHAGHVATLRAARALGDGLVVLLNDDASVARLKGPERPLNRATDRATVLEALGCVDAVAVFGEDTPAEALRAIRPQVWAKGGDYAGRELPEASVLRGWGGRVTILPHLPGRSTTRLIQEATCRRAV